MRLASPVATKAITKDVPTDLVGTEPEGAVGSLGQAQIGSQHNGPEQVVRTVVDDQLEQRSGQGQHDQHDDDDRSGNGAPVPHEPDPEQRPRGTRDRTRTARRWLRLDLLLGQYWLAHVALRGQVRSPSPGTRGQEPGSDQLVEPDHSPWRQPQT